MAEKIVYETESGGIVIVHPTGEVSISELIASVIPSGVSYEVVDDSIIPTDRRFRSAWKLSNVGVTSIATGIYEDLELTKAIAHKMRRNKRTIEFLPHDEVIMKQIPGSDAIAAEAARAHIRSNFDIIQSTIENSTDIDSIKLELLNRDINTP